ncbi:MAG: glucoamylase family protein [Chloroflexota bacterium]
MKPAQSDAEPRPSADRAPVLDDLQKQTFSYFRREYNPDTGLIADKTRDGCPGSICATGFGLTCYPVAVEHGWMEREEAIHRTLTLLRFLQNAEQSQSPQATGYKGFYYHFLDLHSGKRAWHSELSTIDTAFLLSGALAAAQYFDHDTEEEQEIRDIADHLYRRVDWRWALNHSATLSHGWKPEHGFLKSRWQGYDESLLLYILALGSPTHPLEPENYEATVADYAWRNVYGYDYVYAGPLFVHQYPHVWLDLHEIQNDYIREKGIDYFENSRRATHIHQQYAIHNPKQFAGYGEFFWGITASDGPGPRTTKVDGIERTFFDYLARGVPDGPDDGTIAPWAVVSSLPFAPEIVLDTIRYFNSLNLQDPNPYGYKATINREYPHDGAAYGWISKYHYGINQGPVVLMIENYQSEFVWRLMRGCEPLRRGLRRAGFRGGWL